MFMGTGAVFLVTRLPRELDELATFGGDEDIEAFVIGTPAEVHALQMDDLGTAALELSTRQRLNVSLVALFSQGLQITLVTLLVASFFVVFGLLTVTPEIIESWLGHTGDELLLVQHCWARPARHGRAAEDQHVPRPRSPASTSRSCS